MKLTKLVPLVALAAFAIGLTGCATKPPKVNTEYDSAASFTEATTFVILPLPKNIPGADPGVMMRLGPTIEQSVRDSMTAKGYTETMDKAEADIAVLIHGKLVPKTDVTDWGFTPTYGAYGWNRGYRGYYGGMSMGSNVTVDQYDEGTLIGEVYDVESKSMIWVGWMSARANTKREGQEERAATAVTRLLNGYPPVGMMPVTDMAEK